MRISVGESWITVCDGIHHRIFLENEETGLPGGACRGEWGRRLEDRVRHIETILDEPEDDARD